MLRRVFNHWISAYSGIPNAVWLLALVNFINRCGGMVLIFMTVYLKGQLGYSVEAAGYVMTCFGVGALAGNYFGGIVVDRLGYYTVQFYTLVLNGVMLFILMAVTDFWWMCATVFALSLLSEAFRPANQVAVGRYSQPENRTRSVSVLRLAFNLGFTVAPALGGILAYKFGWAWLFWADGITCIVAALVLRLLLSPKNESSASHEVAREQEVQKSYLSPYRDRPYLAFGFFTLLSGVVFMQIMWTVPLFFTEVYGWTAEESGYAMALNGLIVFAVEMPLIFNIEGRRSVLSFVRIGLILYALSYLMFLVSAAGTVFAAVAYMVFISFGEIFVMPFSSNFAYSRAAARSNQGQFMALYTMCYSLANIIAPFLGTQIIARWGYDTLWIVVAALSLVSLGGFWWLEQRISHHHTQPAVLTEQQN